MRVLINSNALIFSLLILLSTYSYSATINFLFDDFEQESLALNYNNFQNWVATDGTVDSIGPGLAGLNCQSSRVCVDLDGSTGDSAILSTVDEFNIGSYNLSFDLSGSQRSGTNTVLVNFGNYSQSITLSSTDGWETFEAIVNVEQLSQLSFENIGGDNIGLLLDNVSISQVPLPPSILLFFSALLSLLAFYRNKVNP